jgi:pimeloyl-ACP methyl ester carboxylesterase
MEPRPTVIRAGGADFSVLRRNSGSALIFMVHGLGCAKECFSGAFACPELSSFSLIAMDLLGHGGSPLPSGFDSDMAIHAEGLRALVGSVPHERLHIVAHSLGGAPTLLMLDDGSLRPSSYISIEGNLVASDCGLVSRRAAGVDEATFVKEKWPRLLDRISGSGDPMLRQWGAWMQRVDPNAFYRCSVSLCNWSDGSRLLAIYRELTCPRTYICGALSKVTETLAALGGERVIEIPDCGHFPMLEIPGVFYPLLAQLLLEHE